MAWSVPVRPRPSPSPIPTPRHHHYPSPPGNSSKWLIAPAFSLAARGGGRGGSSHPPVDGSSSAPGCSTLLWSWSPSPWRPHTNCLYARLYALTQLSNIVLRSSVLDQIQAILVSLEWACFGFSWDCFLFEATYTVDGFLVNKAASPRGCFPSRAHRDTGETPHSYLAKSHLNTSNYDEVFAVFNLYTVYSCHDDMIWRSPFLV